MKMREYKEKRYENIIYKYNIIPKEKWIGTQTREYQTQAKSPMTHSTQFFAQIPTKSL